MNIIVDAIHPPDGSSGRCQLKTSFESQGRNDQSFEENVTVVETHINTFPDRDLVA